MEIAQTGENALYEKFAKEIVTNVLENLVNIMNGKIVLIRNHHISLNEKLDNLNATVGEEMKVLQLIKKHQQYHVKLIDLKRDITTLNSRFVNLKKRAFKLKDQREAALNQQKKKEHEEEDKLAAKVVLATTSESATGENKHRRNRHKVKMSMTEPTEIESTSTANETASSFEPKSV